MTLAQKTKYYRGLFIWIASGSLVGIIASYFIPVVAAMIFGFFMGIAIGVLFE
jgi:hypothetical protein